MEYAVFKQTYANGASIKLYGLVSKSHNSRIPGCGKPIVEILEYAETLGAAHKLYNFHLWDRPIMATTPLGVRTYPNVVDASSATSIRAHDIIAILENRQGHRLYEGFHFSLVPREHAEHSQFSDPTSDAADLQAYLAYVKLGDLRWYDAAVMVETPIGIRTYRTQADAARATGLSQPTISNAVNGRPGFDHPRGYTIKYHPLARIADDEFSNPEVDRAALDAHENSERAAGTFALPSRKKRRRGSWKAKPA